VQELRASISDSDEMVARWLRGFSREGRGKGGLFIAGRGLGEGLGFGSVAVNRMAVADVVSGADSPSRACS
jgi:hypothetical protein